MKKTTTFSLLLLLGVVLCACNGGQSESSSLSDTGDFANWEAWSIIWQTADTYEDVTVKLEDKQKTYLPEQENYVFLALKAEILNISEETQEMRFAQGPIYLTDRDHNVYDLVGVAYEDTILMAPPYLLENKTRFTTVKWNNDGRFFTVAYQVDPGNWFIQATPDSLFHVDFLFTIPRGLISGLVLQFGKGMTVKIGQ